MNFLVLDFLYGGLFFANFFAYNTLDLDPDPHCPKNMPENHLSLYRRNIDLNNYGYLFLDFDLE
jgi:hypothetical protein